MKKKEEKIALADVVALGSYEEVDGLALERITKDPADANKRLNGMLIYGYETKFADGTNTNAERYSKDCLDKFFAEYYTKKRLNMPLTIQHGNRIEDLAGRVITIEINSVGFYFVCYIPKALPNYETIKALIKEGVLQGLSKEGWATKGHWETDNKGVYQYYLVEEMEMTAVSLVTTPANGNPLEKAAEIKNTTQIIKEPAAPKRFADMFNK